LLAFLLFLGYFSIILGSETTKLIEWATKLSLSGFVTGIVELLLMFVVGLYFGGKEVLHEKQSQKKEMT